MALNANSKVVNLCSHDWANFSYDNSKALNAVGIDCKSYKIFRHEFGYDSESSIIGFGRVKAVCKNASVIQIFHSDVAMYNIVSRLHKNIVVWHTGTKYRQDPHSYNAYFQGCKIIMALGEFMETAPSGAIYLVGAIDTDKYKTKYSPSRDLVIRHHPSNADVKGTKVIVRLMRRYKPRQKLHFLWSDNRQKLSHPLHLKRLDECDAYIEMMAKHQQGKKYGSWGITTLEAACLSKIVITNHTTVDVYRARYGDPQIQIVSNETDFKEALDYVNGLSIDERIALMAKTREWVVEKHGYKASGKMLKKIL